MTGSVTTTRWTPQFEDTFSGTALDASVWNDQKREHESVYAPRTCARVDPSASTDWLGPSNPPDPILAPESDPWHDGMLLIAGALAGAAATVLGPYLWELLQGLVP